MPIIAEVKQLACGLSQVELIVEATNIGIGGSEVVYNFDIGNLQRKIQVESGNLCPYLRL
jgi:uncharacterized protein YaiL (DUF2058 family)